jgi:sugar phosphate isomerase/epimerase
MGTCLSNEEDEVKKMKLGVLTVLFGDRSLEDTLKYLAPLGVQAVELGCGGYVGNAHANPKELLAHPAKIAELKDLLNKYHMEISALSVHGNVLHPNKVIAADFDEQFHNTMLLAEKLGVERVVNFSGCPGDSPAGKYPNWVVQPWPDDFTKIYNYQWNDVVLPYWEKTAAFAKDHGVKVCIEMHPGFCVYNPESFLKLRNSIGEVIGCNFDPSNIMWQGINPSAAIRKLGKTIYHVHAKDSSEDMANIRVNGRLDPKPYTDEANRAWIFRVLGYGHDTLVWKDMISDLVMQGYDDVISIEHEDALMTATEGFEKAVNFLKSVMVFEKSTGLWWANQ